MPPRRPAPDGGESGPPQQRIRSENGSAVPVAKPAPAAGGPTAAGSAGKAMDIQAQIAAAKARAAALAASLGRAPAAGSAASASARPAPAASSSSSAAAPSLPNQNDIQARIAAAKARISGMTAGGAAGTPARPPPAAFAPKEEKPTGLHPLLMQKWDAKGPLQPMAPMFSTVKANAQQPMLGKKGKAPVRPPPAEPIANPYLKVAAEIQEEQAQGSSSSAPRNRSTHKGFQFHRPGKIVERADELRREAKLEEMKRRIAENAKKAGLDGSGEERVLKKRPPPLVEWWDADLIGATGAESSTMGYDSVSLDPPHAGGSNGKARAQDEQLPQPLIEGENSPITIYIQHPIPIPPPGHKDKIPMRGVMLTKKEMKKLRRQRRKAEQEDKRDRIKMGLLPPPPPKVKLSNLMRVLTSEAVADPTKIEARVRREVAARKEAHERMNEERKLTPDQRRDKLATQREKDEMKGLGCLVFKIQHLVSPAHKFKIRKNAQQLGLTGITVFGPSFALVIVEGGAKAIKAYRRLMTVRIDWTDPGRPKDGSDDEGDGTGNAGEGSSAAARDNAAAQEEIQHIDWSSNKCELIFEGPIRERTWPTGFRGRGVETDADAREQLGSRASLWDVAKKWNTAIEEV